MQAKRAFMNNKKGRKQAAKCARALRKVIKSLKRIDAAPPEASFDNAEDMLAWLNDKHNGR